MNRDLEMAIRPLKEMKQDFRLFIVTHGGSIEKCLCIDFAIHRQKARNKYGCNENGAYETYT